MVNIAYRLESNSFHPDTMELGEDDDVEGIDMTTAAENYLENDLSMLGTDSADDDDDEPEGRRCADDESTALQFVVTNKSIKMLVDGKLFKITSGNQGKCLKCDTDIVVHGSNSLTKHLVSRFH